MKKSFIFLSLFIFYFGNAQEKKDSKRRYISNKKDYVKKYNRIITKNKKKSNIIANNSEIVDNILKKNDVIDSKIAEKILKRNTRRVYNSDTQGKVTVKFKGTYVNPSTSKVYFLLEIDNNSYIEYNIEAISFTLNSSKGELLETGDRFFTPTGSFPNQSIFKGKTKTNIVLAFNKISISEKNSLSLYISENQGYRDLNINIKGKWIVEAKAIY